MIAEIICENMVLFAYLTISAFGIKFIAHIKMIDLVDHFTAFRILESWHKLAVVAS